MVQAMQEDYDGWNIITVCQEAKLHDWAPGQPTIYSIRGMAEYHRPADYRPGYKNTLRIDLPVQNEPAHQFFDYNKAHEYVRFELRKAIDQRKLA